MKIKLIMLLALMTVSSQAANLTVYTYNQVVGWTNTQYHLSVCLYDKNGYMDETLGSPCVMGCASGPQWITIMLIGDYGTGDMKYPIFWDGISQIHIIVSGTWDDDHDPDTWNVRAYLVREIRTINVTADTPIPITNEVRL